MSKPAAEAKVAAVILIDRRNEAQSVNIGRSILDEKCPAVGTRDREKTKLGPATRAVAGRAVQDQVNQSIGV
jgi:hypothetical protein